MTVSWILNELKDKCPWRTFESGTLVDVRQEYLNLDIVSDQPRVHPENDKREGSQVAKIDEKA